ncbi:DEAD/DEAH box helicase [Thiohalocapsa marina]|uniref:DEAD/DEAH box helicase n=1 Tax=Thiohalocapsa marina TaxID=424902 RepID=UPI0036DECC15
MDDVFSFRDQLIEEYGAFSRSFTRIAACDILQEVERQYAEGRYWPEPLIQINPNYQRKTSVQQLSEFGDLHPTCAQIFQVGKTDGHPQPLTLYTHQVEALAKARQQQSYVVTTGTGSGKSLAFFIPIVDRILRAKQLDPTPRTRAIVIYPMNALANSQLEELDKFLYGFPADQQPFTVARYTGQEREEERQSIADNPPDILLTNFMMLELILTRFEDKDRRIIEHCHGLEYLVLDELHTYRGRQGADVALLVRRLRERVKAEALICIGTSATMSSTGSLSDRNETVAAVSSKLFGTRIGADDVIGETLERVTNPSLSIPAVRSKLAAALDARSFNWLDFAAFQDDPVAIWVELTLGLELPPEGGYSRARPMTLREAGEKLAQDAECDEELAREGLQAFLIAAHEVETPHGRMPFAFKLHQFISGPGKVLATLEAPGQRQITLDAQRFAPGRQEQGVQLYPVHFCRDCGQEYHPVWRSDHGGVSFTPREIDDVSSEDNEDVRFGFLCPTRSGQYYGGQIEDLPEIWLDFSKAKIKVKSSYKKALPELVSVEPLGEAGPGEDYWFIPGKFRFCISCGQVHEAIGRDINRLSSLSGEGRSSATTMLTLSSLRYLFDQADADVGLPDPRKLLGFVDNRQDAALQAGHFNDFIFLLTLRSGLIGALEANSGELIEEDLADAVFKALGFDRSDLATLLEYLKTPKLIGLARQEAQRTLRFIIGYRLIRDLRRGWRFNNPNLDQLGLLRIGYRGLEEFCAEAGLFSDNHYLSALKPSSRALLCAVIFDEMRRSLCLQSRYLDAVEQDKARTNAFQHLNERWAFAADENLEVSRSLVLGKRPEHKGKPRTDLVTGGPRSRLLKRVKMADLWKETPFSAQINTWKDQQLVEVVQAVLERAENYGYVQRQSVTSQMAGWRLNASAMVWQLIDESDKVNPFFRDLYLSVAALLRKEDHPLYDFEAQEHTAQVDSSRRKLLEQRFRYTEKDRQDWEADEGHDTPLERLPVMYCSPTMELGVDISALNTVYLRNVPPTPANYAQRSGRAGRSGQQALVITYCAALSPHDQWFFHNANEMVHGVVKAPTLDLTNRDLVESHLHAVWLACAQVQLDSSIAPMLDLEQDGKPLQQELWDRLSDDAVNQRAQASAEAVVSQLADELKDSDWFSDAYVKGVVDSSPEAFSEALDRWRALFDATRAQMDMADQIVKSHVTTTRDRVNAQRRYGDAARQYAILLKSGNTQNSDFYTYRYLASQGFLPGYNFPRLPLMAWIPARGGFKSGGKDDEGSMVSRPRFLALSEFGPRSLIYHQGRTYRVIRAKLNVGSTDHVSGNSQLATLSSLVCSQCGYGHIGEKSDDTQVVNTCENCGVPLGEGDWVKELYRIETVETIATERISINDEERQRQGFELQTTYRFMPGPDGKIQKQDAEVRQGDDVLAALTYASSARIWRINRGWRRRKDKHQLGFYINPITGTWSKQDDPNASDAADKDDPMLDKVQNQRIVPFVEDHRNLLILTPVTALSPEAMATLQAALKRGIEMTFQIEESELVAEPLPKQDERKGILFYEAAEGGAGVLTRLANEPESLALAASNALQLMHFKTPEGPWDLTQLDALDQRDQQGNRTCEAGCYQCLLSYYNQPDHEIINRRDTDALRLLVALANAQVTRSRHTAPEPVTDPSPDGKLAEWLAVIEQRGLTKPDATSVPVQKGTIIAAGQYKGSRSLVFLTPVPPEISTLLTDKGWRLLDFSDPASWDDQFAQHPDVFGVST